MNRVAVVINEIGEIGIDNDLVKMSTENVSLLANGCLCCTVRKDLVRGVQNLLKKGGFDYLLIETTGIAAPVVVEHADLAAEPGQAVDQGRAEETGAAGDEGGHEAVASPSPWLPRQT